MSESSLEVSTPSTSDPHQVAVNCLNTVKRTTMADLCDEELKLVFIKLPLLDSIRARTVCRRWRDRINIDVHAHVSSPRSYCPLIFERSEYGQHTWLGYLSKTNQWEPLPPITHGPQDISLLPFAGSGKGPLGFKITSQLSGYIVVFPYEGHWKTLPTSVDSWGHASMFMISNEDQNHFRVISFGDEETHIYKSRENLWAKVERTPQSVSTTTIDLIKSKRCAVLCDELLYCVGGIDNQNLISFNVRTEQWTNECFNIPPLPKGAAVRLVKCVGRVFAVTVSDNAIAVWGLGIRSREFSAVVEIPEEYLDFLFRKNGKNGRAEKFRCVGHKHQVFFWCHKSLSIVVFDLLLRSWDFLPRRESSSSIEEVIVDMGSFEPFMPG